MENLNINSKEYLFKCTSCNELKPNSEFSKDLNVKRERKYKYYCKSCIIEKNLQKGTYNKSQLKRRLEDPLAYLYYSSLSTSRKNRREFSLTKEDLKNQFEKQNGKCYYTNRDLNMELGNSDSVSIDRINPDLGYHKDNIVLTQWKVNRMKSDATIEELLQFCEDILQNKQKLKGG